LATRRRTFTTAEAAAHIFGYVCLNDNSDRTTQVDAEGQQALSHQLGSARQGLEGALTSGRGGGSPRPERFVS
jgi:2-keto-4-pentenoate hydratase/2-oxohepta-3-ene-1,7-dioic acid hydratase in catechol pathway